MNGKRLGSAFKIDWVTRLCSCKEPFLIGLNEILLIWDVMEFGFEGFDAWKISHEQWVSKEMRRHLVRVFFNSGQFL